MRSLRITLSALLIFVPCSLLAQQPKILAPHKPVAPRVPRHREWDKPAISQVATGALWMTDGNFKATLYLDNVLTEDPLTVTPVLHLGNGVAYPLEPVTLEPSGTAAININQSLGKQGVAPYATLSGYVEVQYQWGWSAICGSVWNVDTTHSLIFVYDLRQPPSASVQQAGQAANANAQPQQTLEGMWWKQEPNVSGFVGLSNLTERPISASVQTLDVENHPIGNHSVTISPNGTKIVELTELLSTTASAGGLVLTWNGNQDELAVNSSLQDPSVGYSARLPLGFRPDAAAKVSQRSYAELGLMTGPPDPMMSFPSSVVFTPYSVLRNLSEQHVSVTPTIWLMESGAPRSAQLPQLTLASHQTVKLDMLALLATAGLKNYQGSFNLVLDTVGPNGAVLFDAGSVDQSYTYVFEVVPRAIWQSAGRGLQYWSTANGDDTMVTLWNPADEAQDFVFTLFYSGGHYLYRIYLEARATHTFNVSEIIHSSIPDSEGNVVPAAIQAGSAKIAGSIAENQEILVAMDSGIYNVRKATCGGTVCSQCDGFTNLFLVSNPFAVAVGGNTQESATVQWNTGAYYDYSNQSSWSSSNTSVATVSSGLVTGVSVGGLDLSFVINGIPPAATPCGPPGGPPPLCPGPAFPQASGPGDSTPSVSFSPISYVVVGQTATTNATVTPSNNSQPISLSISSPAAIVTPAPPATFTGSTSVVVKGLSAGTATLTATVSNSDGTNPPVGSISFPVTSAPPTATMTQRTSGTVSSDDAAKGNYQSVEGTTNLGAIIGSGTSKGCFIGYETIGAITPSSYTGNVTLHRTIASWVGYTNSTSTGGPPTGTDDTSVAPLRDDDPQSGGSNGKVYDLDAPGAQPPNVDGKTYRIRANFYAYAALPDGTTISSQNYNFYVRLSCTKTSTGYQFVNDISGDNQIGPGTTKTTWNLQ